MLKSLAVISTCEGELRSMRSHPLFAIPLKSHLSLFIPSANTLRKLLEALSWMIRAEKREKEAVLDKRLFEGWKGFKHKQWKKIDKFSEHDATRERTSNPNVCKTHA